MVDKTRDELVVDVLHDKYKLACINLLKSVNLPDRKYLTYFPILYCVTNKAKYGQFVSSGLNNNLLSYYALHFGGTEDDWYLEFHDNLMDNLLRAKYLDFFDPKMLYSEFLSLRKTIKY